MLLLLHDQVCRAERDSEGAGERDGCAGTRMGPSGVESARDPPACWRGNRAESGTGLDGITGQDHGITVSRKEALSFLPAGTCFRVSDSEVPGLGGVRL